MKPNTRQAMADLIARIRHVFPFDQFSEDSCSAEKCSGCSMKLLEHLDTLVEDWGWRLQQDEQPTFGDLEKLARTSRKIHAVLLKNGVIEAS